MSLRTSGSFRILLPFFRTSWGVGVLHSAIFNSFHNPVEFGMILEGLQNFGGGLNTPNHPLGMPLLPILNLDSLDVVHKFFFCVIFFFVMTAYVHPK